MNEKNIAGKANVESDEMKALWQKYGENPDDTETRNQLIIKNQGLVYHIINSKFGFYKGADREDLVSVGNVGLILAIKRFDPTLGRSFSTFAYPTIRGTILNYLRDNQVLTATEEKRKLYRRAKRAEEEYQNKYGSTPTYAQVAAILKVSEEKLVDAINACEPIASLDDMLPLLKHESKDADIEISAELKERINRYWQKLTGNKEFTVGDIEYRLQDLYYDGDHTRHQNEVYLQRLAKLDRPNNAADLLNMDPMQWIYEITDIDANSYFNRLVASLCPKFAEAIDNEDYVNLSARAVRIRNQFTKRSIQDNMHNTEGHPINSITLYPNCSFTNIEDALTRNDRLFNVNHIRDKVFLAALVFNLSYPQLETLLVHSLGERKIDFKNPYEIMLAFCFKEERPTCEHYLALKNQYEQHEHHNRSANNFGTLTFEQMFWKTREDKDLLHLLSLLPEETSQTANQVFSESIDSIRNQLVKRKSYDKIRDYVKGDLVKFAQALASLDLHPEYRPEVSNTELTNYLLGNNFRRRGNFDFLKMKVFDNVNIGEIENGRQKVTKEQLLTALFFEYCLGEEYTTLKQKVDNGELSKTELYYAFKGFADPDLETAGFDHIYLPASFELFIMYCLVTPDPLKAFQTIMQL